MRNGLAGFFVLGCMVPGVGLLGAFVMRGSARNQLRVDDALATMAGTVLAYLVCRFIGMLIMACRSVRREPPHELFKPLYENRPHEWTLRAA